MSWELKSFTDLGFIGRGRSRHRPRNDESLYGGKYPMVQTGEVKSANFYLNSFTQTYNDKGLAQSKLWQPNTLCITIAANIAETAILSIDACFPDSIIGFVADENESDVRFIKYFFDVYKINMQSVSQGTTQDNLSLEKLLTFKVPTPHIKTQKRIADILSSYDDLIENNLKRIKLLEQAAQNIYKEWFVNMRFPGHENTPIDEETGLPEGWEEKGICEFNSFKQYKSKIQSFVGEKEYLATANINGIAIEERGDLFTYDNKPSRAQIHPPLNSVWFARMSKTDKVLLITEKTNNDFMISSGFAGFKAEKKEVLPFLFCMINNSKFSKLKDANATGSTQVSINNKSLNSIKFIEPTYEMIEKFGALNYDSLELIQYLFKANEKLKSARDILLPRLMNQTIEV